MPAYPPDPNKPLDEQDTEVLTDAEADELTERNP
jgi:hypothetical protein